MPFNNYPYTDFHDTNLDWIIRNLKRIDIKLEKAIKGLIYYVEDEERLVLNNKKYICTKINNKLDCTCNCCNCDKESE